MSALVPRTRLLPSISSIDDGKGYTPVFYPAASEVGETIEENQTGRPR
jgi:hypothetical protein